MSFRVEWDAAAEAQWKGIPSLATATKVARRVYEYAASGRGAERLGPTRYRLSVAGYDVVLTLDAAARTIYVVGVFERQ